MRLLLPFRTDAARQITGKSQEPCPQLRSFSRIGSQRLRQFGFRRGEEPGLHSASLFFMSAKTAPASRAGSAPDSKASIRRSDSAAHAASRALTSGSVNESHKTSIIRRRSLTGRLNSSFWIAVMHMAAT